MSLSSQTIKEFQTICREEYGEDLNMQEAHLYAHALVGCFDLFSNWFYEDQQDKPYDDN